MPAAFQGLCLNQMTLGFFSPETALYPSSARPAICWDGVRAKPSDRVFERLWPEASIRKEQMRFLRLSSQIEES